MEEKFRFRTEDERIDYFAKGEHYGNDFYYAGLFYNNQADYMENIAKYFYKLRKRDESARKDFGEFLEKNEPIKGEAKYSVKEITGWLKPWNIFKNTKKARFPRWQEGSRFNIYELKLENPSEVDKKSGLIFLKVESYEDQVLTRELEWEIRKDLIEEWKKLSESDDVKGYLDEVAEAYDILEEAIPKEYAQGLSRKLAYYLFPIDLDTFRGKIVVSKASLYKRRDETRKEFWNEFLKEMEDKDYKEDLNYVLKERGKDLDHLKNLLEKALSDDHLKLLRDDWKKFLKKCLKGESEKLKAAFVGKVKEENPSKISYGIYEIPSVELKLMVFAEKGFNIDGKSAEEVVKILKQRLEKFIFLGNAKIVVEDKIYSLEEGLFGGEEFFKLIKGLGDENSNKLKPLDSLNLIHTLSYFTARISNLTREIKDGRFKGEFRGVLLLLNTELEESERYPLWSFVNFIYEYFGIPVQTVTKRSLRAIIKGGKEANAVIKNLAISLYKDSKVLEVDFDGFYLPSDFVVYAIVEKPSTRFFYRRNQMDGGARHYLYEIYKITIKDKKARIELEDKIFELQGMKEIGIERFIEEHKQNKNVKFCFITALKESKLGNIYEGFSKDEGKFLLIRYDELKTAYFSEKTEQDCFIIYTDDMRDLMKKFGIQMDKDEAAIAVKPAHAKSIDDEMYHPTLQLFFTKKLGWATVEEYSRKKNLFLFTVIALSMHESESYTTPFSKLRLWSKERNYYLDIRRQEKDYYFPLKPVLYEMLKFAQVRPGKRE